MKKITYLLFIVLTVFFSACKKKGNVDVQNLDYWIKNCSAPFQVQFTLEIGYQPTDVSVNWDFGDGFTSNEMSPIHIYQNTGTYTAKVKIINYQTVVEKSLVIDVSNDPMTPVLDFDYKSTYGKIYAPCQIEFYNKTQYASQFFWDFGDGSGSMDDSPTHIYDTHGTYNIKLHAICNDTTTEVYQMQILPPPTKISIDVVNVWLPDEFLGAWFALEYYSGIHYETPYNLGNSQATSYPFGWVIGKDLSYFTGNFNDDQLYFEVWDINNNSSPIYSFGMKFSDIKNSYYPDTLSFGGSSGFAADILVSYGE